MPKHSSIDLEETGKGESKRATNLKQNDCKDRLVLRSINRINFVICNSCYWCASYLCIDGLDSSKQVIGCPLCNSHDIEQIPISSNESFRIEYNVARDMDMEFLDV
jgi:ssDNA-binding Zn-finger/Zn-ribbon topoisomerase 1